MSFLGYRSPRCTFYLPLCYCVTFVQCSYSVLLATHKAEKLRVEGGYRSASCSFFFVFLLLVWLFTSFTILHIKRFRFNSGYRVHFPSLPLLSRFFTLILPILCLRFLYLCFSFPFLFLSVLCSVPSIFIAFFFTLCFLLSFLLYSICFVISFSSLP